MKYLGKYKNEPNRLKFWNYSNPVQYYITICSKNRERLFGKIKNKEMILSEYGKIVHEEILKMPQYHKRVILDEWVIMPDHIHLIIELGNRDYDNEISMVGGNVGKNHDFILQPPNPTIDGLKNIVPNVDK